MGSKEKEDIQLDYRSKGVTCIIIKYSVNYIE